MFVVAMNAVAKNTSFYFYVTVGKISLATFVLATKGAHFRHVVACVGSRVRGNMHLPLTLPSSMSTDSNCGGVVTAHRLG